MAKVARRPEFMVPRPYAEHRAEIEAIPRAVYLMEATGPGDPSEWMLKIGQSSNLVQRVRSLAREARLSRATSVQCVGYTFREYVLTTSYESELLSYCEQYWKRIPGTEWFSWTETMRTQIRDRLNADRRGWLFRWNNAQAERVACGEHARSLSVDRGIRLAT